MLFCSPPGYWPLWHHRVFIYHLFLYFLGSINHKNKETNPLYKWSWPGRNKIIGEVPGGSHVVGTGRNTVVKLELFRKVKYENHVVSVQGPSSSVRSESIKSPHNFWSGNFLSNVWWGKWCGSSTKVELYDFRVRTAILALQEASESFLVNVFEDVNVCAIHWGRETI